jgi:thioredoxin-like negative regulator of GroEL
VTTLLCATVLQTALLLSGAETTPAAKVAPAANAAPAAAKTTPAAKATPAAAKTTPAAKAKPVAKAKAAPEKAKPVPETYSAAREDTVKTGKPMVIMVSTDWCPPCQVMKKTVLPRVRAHGLLRKVAFARVNPDQEAELANQITGGGPIPQLVMFRKTRRGWVRKALVGGQSVETVEEFINEALASDKDEKKAEKKTNVVDKSSKRG